MVQEWHKDEQIEPCVKIHFKGFEIVSTSPEWEVTDVVLTKEKEGEVTFIVNVKTYPEFIDLERKTL